jgi:hypothetical protein
MAFFGHAKFPVTVHSRAPAPEFLRLAAPGMSGQRLSVSERSSSLAAALRRNDSAFQTPNNSAQFSFPNSEHAMKEISHVKLFRGSRLPDGDVPIVIVTFEQTQEDRFFAEYFILFPKSQRLDGRRLRGTEHVKEYLELRPPGSVIEDMADEAQAEIEGNVVESLPEEQQRQWVLPPTYTLTPIEFDELRALWIRGRIEEGFIRQIVEVTGSLELKDVLRKIFELPRLTFKEEPIINRDVRSANKS